MIEKIKQLYRLFLSDTEAGRFLRYAFVGGLNTIVGYGAYWVLLQFSVHYILATAISTVVGTIHSYIWNKKFAFRSKVKGAKKTFVEMLRFCSVYAVQYLANIGFTTLFIQAFGLTAEIGGLISLFICTIISYIGHKFWSFRTNKISNKDTLNKMDKHG